uniref:BA14K family protein n=1 Tax=Pararhizobium sp. IMCC3301 TaxID=3067904 RepID=UPI003531FDDB
MKRKHSFISTFSSLMVAVFMIATYSTVADAHSSRYRSNSGASFTFGFSSGGYSASHYDQYRRYPSRVHRHGDRRYYHRGYRHIWVAPRYTAPRHYRNRGSSAHVRWCQNRYRSYDVYSDTFQPYHGARKRCNSPYS